MSEPRWYSAALVVEIRVAGDPRNVVHTNVHLIRAGSVQEAWDLAMALGREENRTWANPAGEAVTSVFRGIHDIQNIVGEPEHGAEVFFTERVGVSEAEVERMLLSREALVSPPDPADRPDFSDGQIVREMLRVLGKEGSGDGSQGCGL